MGLLRKSVAERVNIASQSWRNQNIQSILYCLGRMKYTGSVGTRSVAHLTPRTYTDYHVCASGNHSRANVNLYTKCVHIHVCT